MNEYPPMITFTVSSRNRRNEGGREEVGFLQSLERELEFLGPRGNSSFWILSGLQCWHVLPNNSPSLLRKVKPGEIFVLMSNRVDFRIGVGSRLIALDSRPSTTRRLYVTTNKNVTKRGIVN